jgi:tRNA dimethylallyltransferase
MDIGTGKDLPENSTIWGYDIADPKKEFSVAHFLKFATKKIKEIEKRGKLPILVGGTGFYIKGLTDGVPTMEVPVNKNLRLMLEKKSIDELFESLSSIDSIKAASLNVSDRKNPRRLIRALEVATWMIDHSNKIYKLSTDYRLPSTVLFVGLTATKDVLNDRINKRVDERVKKGAKREVENLIKNGLNWDNQSMMSMGYREWRDYFEGEVDEETVIEEWKKDERKYAKRQMTWFKKDKRIVWFDVSESDYVKKVEILVKKWFNIGDAKKN